MRLYRPGIPIEVKVRVVLRQLGELWPDDVIAQYRRNLGAFHKDILVQLARLLCCDVKDLRLDHDPALATRMRRTVGKKTVYSPDANSVAHLLYREKHDHHIKTNVRGDGAQYPDRVLITRERRRLKKKTKPKVSRKIITPKRKWPSRPFPKRNKR
jgi:hypothetical protein